MQKPMQDLDDVLYSAAPGRVLKPRIQKKEKALQMLTRRQIALMIFAFFEINDVQGKVIGINDLLNRQSQEVR